PAPPPPPRTAFWPLPPVAWLLLSVQRVIVSVAPEALNTPPPPPPAAPPLPDDQATPLAVFAVTMQSCSVRWPALNTPPPNRITPSRIVSCWIIAVPVDRTWSTRSLVPDE